MLCVVLCGVAVVRTVVAVCDSVCVRACDYVGCVYGVFRCGVCGRCCVVVMLLCCCC